MASDTVKTVTVRFNAEKRLAQINVIPRYIETDGVERVLSEIERVTPIVRSKRDAGELSRVVVVVDGTDIQSYFDQSALIMDALVKQKEDESLIDRVLVTNADEETKLQFKVYVAATPSLRKAATKITFVA